MAGPTAADPNPASPGSVLSPADAGETTGMARLLAIADPDDCSDVGLARCVAGGLRPAAVAAIAEAFGGDRNRIVGPVVPEATFRRARKAGRLSREHSGRLYEIARVAVAAARAYRGDRERMEAFMTRPHPLLEGETPFDMARSGPAGADAVLNLIRRAEAGVSP